MTNEIVIRDSSGAELWRGPIPTSGWLNVNAIQAEIDRKAEIEANLAIDLAYGDERFSD